LLINFNASEGKARKHKIDDTYIYIELGSCPKEK
jgi:hypothetical protein